METQQNCMYGTLFIPKLSDVMGEKYKMMFFINKRNIVIVDDDSFSMRIIGRIRRKRSHQANSKAKFIYNFISEFMTLFINFDDIHCFILLYSISMKCINSILLYVCVWTIYMFMCFITTKHMKSSSIRIQKSITRIIYGIILNMNNMNIRMDNTNFSIIQSICLYIPSILSYDP